MRGERKWWEERERGGRKGGSYKGEGFKGEKGNGKLLEIECEGRVRNRENG